MNRILVVGSSCSGKTTFAAELSKILGVSHIEIDAINHMENWTERPAHELAGMVNTLTDGDCWILDGNYWGLKDTVWPKATHMIWLNYPFPLVLYRGLRRTIRRVVFKEVLFSGNVETFRQSFLSTDSVLLYMMSQFSKRRKAYRRIFASDDRWNLSKTELKSPAEATQFLRELTKETEILRDPGALDHQAELAR